MVVNWQLSVLSCLVCRLSCVALLLFSLPSAFPNDLQHLIFVDCVHVEAPDQSLARSRDHRPSNEEQEFRV